MNRRNLLKNSGAFAAGLLATACAPMVPAAGLDPWYWKAPPEAMAGANKLMGGSIPSNAVSDSLPGRLSAGIDGLLPAGLGHIETADSVYGMHSLDRYRRALRRTFEPPPRATLVLRQALRYSF